MIEINSDFEILKNFYSFNLMLCLLSWYNLWLNRYQNKHWGRYIEFIVLESFPYFLLMQNVKHLIGGVRLVIFYFFGNNYVYHTSTIYLWLTSMIVSVEFHLHSHRFCMLLCYRKFSSVKKIMETISFLTFCNKPGMSFFIMNILFAYEWFVTKTNKI